LENGIMLRSIVAAALAGFCAPQAAPELVAAKVSALPAVDGKADDAAWGQARELVLKVDKPAFLDEAKRTVTIKAVHDGTSICFLAVWEDKEKNDVHDPWIWNVEKEEYEAKQEILEDGFSFAFALEGKFDFDMLSGAEAKWDVWEWGAMRTTQGYARDKYHIYSRERPEGEGIRSKRFNDNQEKPFYMARPDDAGTICVKKLEAPEQKKGDKVPQFESVKPTGSAADVEARGTWANGKWTVEFKRKLNTGNKDDTAFAPGKAVPFAIGAFDAAEHSDHEVSRNLSLKLQ
jgi:hypothetical protein